MGHPGLWKIRVECLRILLFLVAVVASASAQQPFQTNSVAPKRFIAAHGRKVLSPGIPFGAQLNAREEHAQDTHADLMFVVPSGRSRCLVCYQGGVEIAVNDAIPEGEASSGVKVVSIAYQGYNPVIEANVA